MPARPCDPLYRTVLYQARERVPVDVIAFHDPAFQQPWWLLVPAGHEGLLPTATVVALYRERMQVEQSFRDFKTHIGLRGLRLQVGCAPKIADARRRVRERPGLGVCRQVA